MSYLKALLPSKQIKVSFVIDIEQGSDHTGKVSRGLPERSHVASWEVPVAVVKTQSNVCSVSVSLCYASPIEH